MEFTNDDDRFLIEEICSHNKTNPDSWDSEFVRQLISKLKNPERKFWTGESPIISAVLKNRKDIVEVSFKVELIIRFILFIILLFFYHLKDLIKTNDVFKKFV
jgi:hypothetical protein